MSVTSDSLSSSIYSFFAENAHKTDELKLFAERIIFSLFRFGYFVLSDNLFSSNYASYLTRHAEK